jgi:hypothetical protein
MKTKTKATTKRDAAQAKRPSAKKAGKVNRPAPKPAKKLSQIEAAVEVLRAAGEPLTCKAMVEAMSARGLWTSPAGKSPDATLYASILRELARKGKDARFIKAAPGRFVLRS